MDLAEAKKLIGKGFRPYVHVVKGRKYITLKRGSREVGVCPFDEDVWRSLVAEYNVEASGQPTKREGESLRQLLDRHIRDHEYIVQRLPELLGYAAMKEAEFQTNEASHQKTYNLKLPKPEKSLFEELLSFLNPFSLFSPEGLYTFTELSCPNPDCKKPIKVRTDWHEVSCIHCGSLLKIQWIG